MRGPVSENDGETRLSARASIALWLVLAGLVWGSVGVIVTYSTQRGGASLRAQADSGPGKTR